MLLVFPSTSLFSHSGRDNVLRRRSISNRKRIYHFKYNLIVASVYIRLNIDHRTDENALLFRAKTQVTGDIMFLGWSSADFPEMAHYRHFSGIVWIHQSFWRLLPGGVGISETVTRHWTYPSRTVYWTGT
jgi:hypothetical protein